ncbi:hypothetical protein D9C73_022482 [Collichthys lucidus]|uniref:Uncharacterized protein n=1 Tax=Collichthys lucidus TaxID=240159 RepID=A0A4U5VKX3_COLLU|nr:hypothetical protein D9C73_022482 [Collichthys lucidus]
MLELDHLQSLVKARLTRLQYGRSDSYRVATTQDKDEKESPKKKGGKDLDDLKKEVPIISVTHKHRKSQHDHSATKALKSQLSGEDFKDILSWPRSSIQRAPIQL